MGAANLPAEPPLLEGKHFARRLFSKPEEADVLEVEIGPAVPMTDPDMAAGVQWNAGRAIQAGEFDAAVIIPPGFGDRLAEFRKDLRKGAAGF